MCSGDTHSTPNRRDTAPTERSQWANRAASVSLAAACRWSPNFR
jgi:hypothetical protein